MCGVEFLFPCSTTTFFAKAVAALKKYCDLNGDIQNSQEACYNLARAYLTFNHPHMAEPLLRRCLHMNSELQRRILALKAAGQEPLPDLPNEMLYLGKGHTYPQQLMSVRDQTALRYLRQQTNVAEEPAAKKSKPVGAADANMNAIRDPFSLKPEIAYNLARIYHKSGATFEARRLLLEYVAW